ncbi:MAG TPA: dihydrolipoamide acetyltransferase family protein [Fredinandcohnia sp.]|nr:dihydrolipoamide acetyltransferase family protein [Fredinandcohnia sp.]
MARFEFKLPDIGEGVVEGEIVQWMVEVGDTVAEDTPIVEIMTDKATVSIPTPKAGKVVERNGKVGDIFPVGGTLVVLETEEGAAETEPAPAPAAAPAAPAAPAVAAAAPTNGATAPVAAKADGRRVLATPVTRRMARELGVDLAAVPGTGPQGRVLKADLLRFVEAEKNQAVARMEPAPVPAAPRVETVAGDQRVPLRGLRRKIAENLVRSKHSAPHYHFVEEVDVTELVAFRERLNAKLAASGEKLTFLPFLVKAVVAALKRHPRCNAVMDEAAQELVIRGEYNIGIAVATEEGLIVPVVRNADRLSLREIAKEILRLSEAARSRRLAPEDLGGGTFTITSLGQTGGLFATPILNHPEVAIMGVHKMRKRPVVDEVTGEIVVRDMMILSFGFDHRNVDGAEGADFAYTVIDLIKDPDRLVMELS